MHFFLIFLSCGRRENVFRIRQFFVMIEELGSIIISRAAVKDGVSMDKKYYLGFDAGTQSVKVAIYDEAGQEVAMATAPTTLLYPQPGWVQMDVGNIIS